jgi:hypothetical protein
LLGAKSGKRTGKMYDIALSVVLVIGKALKANNNCEKGFYPGSCHI